MLEGYDTLTMQQAQMKKLSQKLWDSFLSLIRNPLLPCFMHLCNPQIFQGEILLFRDSQESKYQRFAYLCQVLADNAFQLLGYFIYLFGNLFQAHVGVAYIFRYHMIFMS